MTINKMTINYPNIGISTQINSNFDTAVTKRVEQVLPAAVDEFVSRAGKKGQFLNWVDLPKKQLKRVDEIYNLAEKIKGQTNAKYLSVLGIGGSKHTVEHMLGINGLNVNKDKVLFYSDVDSASFERYLHHLGNDITKSNFLIVSKSGSTFETKDGMLRVKNMLIDTYKAKGYTEKEAKKLASKHFIAVTDANAQGSELRRLADEEKWTGKLYIHDDVGGRFSALDDHALFTLAYAGMKKENMIKMLKGASKMSEIALNKNNIDKNLPLAQAAFWAAARLNGIKSSVHQYMGEMFDSTEKWHTQMQNESIKDSLKQIAKITDAMHHSSEAWYKLGNKFAFALSAPVDHGKASENTKGYIGAITKTNSEYGPSMVETLETKGMGLTPEAAGAMTQARGFATVMQEIIEKKALNQPLAKVLDGVLQPNVEAYKKNLKPIDGNQPPVVAGRISYTA